MIPSLIHVDGQGQLVGKYQFPHYYANDSLKFDFLGVKWHSADPNRKGIKRNKGIESLDRFRGSNNYLAITEAALLQDSKSWNREDGPAPSRMIYFSIDLALAGETNEISTRGEYYYQQQPLPIYLTEKAKPGYPRRGVTDLQIVDDNNAVILERNFIKFKDGSKLLIMTNDNGASDGNPSPTYLLFFKVPASLLTE